MKKKRTLGTAQNPSDKMVRKAWRDVLIKYKGNKCEYPGCTCTKALNGHHIIDKQIHLLRYNPRNGMLLCFYHHKMGLVSAHKDPFFIEKMLEAGVIKKERIEWLRFIYDVELERMEKKEKRVDNMKPIEFRKLWYDMLTGPEVQKEI